MVFSVLCVGCTIAVILQDAGHVDGRVLVQTVAGALEWLWAGYEPTEA